MISDYEQDIDMREKNPSFSETSRMKNSNMELDDPLNMKGMLESSVYNTNEMNGAKEMRDNMHFEKNSMGFEISRNGDANNMSNVENVNELKENIPVCQISHRSKRDGETIRCNNEKMTGTLNCDSVAKMQEQNNSALRVALSEKDCANMEIENSTSENTTIPSFSSKTLTDVAKGPNLSELYSKDEEPKDLQVDISTTNRKINDMSEIVAVVCGVPVMISDCEQDIEMKEKKDASFNEDNLGKVNSNVEFDDKLGAREMTEKSGCISDEMNLAKETNLCDMHFEKISTEMEFGISRNEKDINHPKEDILMCDQNSKIVICNNKKISETLNEDTAGTGMQEQSNSILSIAGSVDMEIENSVNEESAILSSTPKILKILEKSENLNLFESHSKENKPNVSSTDKEMDGISSYMLETAKEVKKEQFYAVARARPSSETESAECIFTSKTDALAAIKKYPGARFMQFDSIDDAIEYSSKPLPLFTALTTLEEKPSKYKSISSQQMVALRKAIEKGDEVTFLDSVWSNPRYLINNAGDGPTVMQEGTRYNALHVAARFKQSAMCVTILNTIQDHQFMSLLYPQENQQMIEYRISRLVDLYLNTPDKALSETPLHFACKFGADEILSILLSYHECDIHKRNKYGLTPREMICDRTSHHPEFKEKMNMMFEDVFYVPILRDLRNNIQEPVIGKACCSNIFLASTSSELAYGENNLVYCAFAGPMSESEADNFYIKLKKRKFTENLSFTPEEKKKLINICLSDSVKGLERVGRKLAKELKVGWIEFWPALQFWGDLSNEGLEILEKRLKNHCKNKHLSNGVCLMAHRCENLKTDILNFVNDFVRSFPEILKNINKMTFFVLFQTLIPHLLCLTKSTFSETKELYMIHNEIGRLLCLKLIVTHKESFEDFKFYLNKQFHVLDRLLKFHANDSWKMFICILKCMCYSHFSKIKCLRPPKCDCNWNIQRKFYYSSYFAHKSIWSECEDYRGKQGMSSAHHEFFSRDVSPESSLHSKSKVKDNTIVIPFQNLSLDAKAKNFEGDAEMQDFQSCATEFPIENTSSVFYLSNDSIEAEGDMTNTSKDNASHSRFIEDNSTKNSPLEDTDDEFESYFTPPESPLFNEQEVFINGVNEFTDLDIDIFRAIVDSGAKINQSDYPCVFEWKRLMESKLKSLLNPDDKLSCTPASSSASLRRAITPIDRVRRALF